MEAVKLKITETVKQEAEQWLGCGMTYTLFECLKERIDELMEDQITASAIDETVGESDEDEEESDDSDSDDSDDDKPSTTKKQPKKEQLTKAQKRRQWDQTTSGAAGEKPRGWDWVDIVKHLAQVGSKDEQGAIPQNYEG